MAQFSGQIPVYQQIIQRLKADIVAGRLKCGDRLPSVRELSESMTVNPNTIQRVIMELEREGITYSQRGVGSFVSDDPGLAGRLKKEEAQKYAARFVEEMRSLGMDRVEITQTLDAVMEGIGNGNSKI